MHISRYDDDNVTNAAFAIQIANNRTVNFAVTPLVNSSNTVWHAGNLMVQRGYLNIPGATTTTVTFPIAYSTTPIVVITLYTATGYNLYQVYISSISTTGFTIYNPNGTSASYSCGWIAINL